MSNNNAQRMRKNNISDKLTWAMGRVGLLLVGVVVLVGLPTYGLHALYQTVDIPALEWITTALTLAMVPVFVIGFWFGKTEVRGFLGGVDTALDKLATAVDMRDSSKVRTHHALKADTVHPPAGAFNVYLPQPQAQVLPPITHRSAISTSDVVDL